MLAATLPFSAAAADNPKPGNDEAHLLLQQYRCSICHDETETKAGPAYVDIARVYRGRSNARNDLVRLIKRGQHGGGPWNMPPHPEISDADAGVLATYILSVRK